MSEIKENLQIIAINERIGMLWQGILPDLKRLLLLR